MKLRQLCYAVTAAETSTFTAAARALYVTQSTISEQINQLESELGVSLFYRTTGGLRPTMAGHAFLQKARRILQEVQTLQQEMGEYQAGAAKRIIRLGLVPSALMSRVPALLYRTKGLDVEVTEQSTGPILKHLARGDLDLGVVTLDASAEAAVAPVDPDRLLIGQEGLGVRPVYSEDFVALVPRAHALARGREVTLNELSGERFVGMPKGFALREIVEEACRRAGFTPWMAYEVQRPDGCWNFVRAELAVSILPASAFPADPGVVPLKIVGHSAPRRMLAVVHRQPVVEPGTPLAILVDILEEAVLEHSPDPVMDLGEANSAG